MIWIFSLFYLHLSIFLPITRVNKDCGYFIHASIFWITDEFNLEIQHVTLEDNARFQCQVGPGKRGEPGIRSRFATLTVLVPPERPEIVQGEKLTTTEDREIELECVSKNGKPAATVIFHDFPLLSTIENIFPPTFSFFFFFCYPIFTPYDETLNHLFASSPSSFHFLICTHKKIGIFICFIVRPKKKNYRFTRKKSA